MRKLVAVVMVIWMAATAMAQPSTNVAGGIFQTANIVHKYVDESNIQTVETFNSNKTWTVSNGTAANQMTKMWQTRVSLAGSATKTFDLAGGLTNRFGIPFSFSSIKYIQVNAADGNSGTVSMGNEIAHWASLLGATNQSITFRPSVGMSITAPGTNSYAVTATTGDLLKFTNNDAAYTNILDITLGGI